MQTVLDIEYVLMMTMEMCVEIVTFSGLVYIVHWLNDYSTHLNYQGGHTTLQHHYYENNIVDWKILNNLVLEEMFQCHHRSCNQTRWLQYPVQTLYD